jgi:protein dispatched 1
VKLLLLECFQYYHNLKLGNDCTQSKSCRVPTHCAQNNAVYNILHYLTDIDFIKPNVSEKYIYVFLNLINNFFFHRIQMNF